MLKLQYVTRCPFSFQVGFQVGLSPRCVSPLCLPVAVPPGWSQCNESGWASFSANARARALLENEARKRGDPQGQPGTRICVQYFDCHSLCQPPWLTWNFWMNTHWQLVGFYVSMPCSQKVCKNVQIQHHQHGTYLALIPLMNFNMGALTWNLFFIFFAQRWFSGE